MDKISLIIPVYNMEKYLSRCLNSLVQQSYKNVEIILVNDGSTDKSSIICEQYSAKDTRIKVVDKKNGGASSARNEGLKYVTGEFIGFIDSDDWVSKDMYEQLLSALKKYNGDVAICNYYLEYEFKTEKFYKGEVTNVIFNANETKMHMLKNKLFGGHLWNKLYKKELFDNLIFDENLDTMCEDLVINWNVFKMINKAVYISYPGYFYVQREDSRSKREFHKKLAFGIKAYLNIYNSSKNESKDLEKMGFYRYKLFTMICYIRALLNGNKSDIKEYRDYYTTEIMKFFIYNCIPIKYKLCAVSLLMSSSLSKLFFKMLYHLKDGRKKTI